MSEQSFGLIVSGVRHRNLVGRTVIHNFFEKPPAQFAARIFEIPPFALRDRGNIFGALQESQSKLLRQILHESSIGVGLGGAQRVIEMGHQQRDS